MTCLTLPCRPNAIVFSLKSCVVARHSNAGGHYWLPDMGTAAKSNLREKANTEADLLSLTSDWVELAPLADVQSQIDSFTAAFNQLNLILANALGEKEARVHAEELYQDASDKLSDIRKDYVNLTKNRDEWQAVAIENSNKVKALNEEIGELLRNRTP